MVPGQKGMISVLLSKALNKGMDCCQGIGLTRPRFILLLRSQRYIILIFIHIIFSSSIRWMLCQVLISIYGTRIIVGIRVRQQRHLPSRNCQVRTKTKTKTKTKLGQYRVLGGLLYSPGSRRPTSGWEVLLIVSVYFPGGLALGKGSMSATIVVDSCRVLLHVWRRMRRKRIKGWC